MVQVQKIAPGISGLENTSSFNRMSNMKKKRCSYDGVEYESISAIAKAMKVTVSTISKSIKSKRYRGKELLVIK